MFNINIHKGYLVDMKKTLLKLLAFATLYSGAIPEQAIANEDIIKVQKCKRLLSIPFIRVEALGISRTMAINSGKSL